MLLLGACGTRDFPNTPTKTPKPSTTPLPGATPVPKHKPTPTEIIDTPTPAPTGTPDMLDVQAGIVVNICSQYRPIVEDMYQYFPIDPDVVMAVMAQESHCDKWATDGLSIGLMQITPRPWTLREDLLWDPKWNIWQGMKMLHANIYNNLENPEHSVARALAAYNCGWTSLNANACLDFGGWQYAAEVVNFWLPYFR
jgi:hypothetical protein